MTSAPPVSYEVLVLLGNRQPVIPADADADDPTKVGGRTEPETVNGPRITALPFPHGDYLNMMKEVEVIVGPLVEEALGNVEDETRVHFRDTTAPAWVESTDTALAQLLSSHYKCPVGRPDDWPTGWPHPTLSEYAAGYGITVEA